MTNIFDTILTVAEVSVLIPTVDVMSVLNLYEVYQLHNELEDMEGASPTLFEHRPKPLAVVFPLSGVTGFADRRHSFPTRVHMAIPVFACDLRGSTNIDAVADKGWSNFAPFCNASFAPRPWPSPESCQAATAASNWLAA
jgi:hypothetical protein